MTADRPSPDADGIAYAAVERATFDRAAAASYLGLPTKSLQRLVGQGQVVPLTYTRPFVFARAELDRFIADELEAERRRRRIRG